MINIDLSAQTRFCQYINLAIMVLICLMYLFTIDQPLSVSCVVMSIALVLIWHMVSSIINWETKQCLNINTADNSYSPVVIISYEQYGASQWVLNTSKCRLSPVGCWLSIERAKTLDSAEKPSQELHPKSDSALQQVTLDKKHHHSQRVWPKVCSKNTTIFVAQNFVPAPEYRSLCRLIIWGKH